MYNAFGFGIYSLFIKDCFANFLPNIINKSLINCSQCYAYFLQLFRAIASVHSSISALHKLHCRKLIQF